MKRTFVLLLLAGASLAQQQHDLSAERQRALELMNNAQPLAALPLVEDLVAANADDGVAQGWLCGPVERCRDSWQPLQPSGTPEERNALRLSLPKTSTDKPAR